MNEQCPLNYIKQMYGASVFLNKGEKNIVPYYDILYANQNFEP